MNLTEVKKDILTVYGKYVLAHCISADCAMGAGIAKQFARRYPDMREAIRPLAFVNFAVRYDAGNRKIYNLVTKQKYYQKPSLDAVRYALGNLSQQMRFHNERHLAMPRIGCDLDGRDLDRLNWESVRDEIEFVFKNQDVTILICSM